MLTNFIWTNCFEATDRPNWLRLQASLKACLQIPKQAPTVFQITISRLCKMVASTPVLYEAAPGSMASGGTFTPFSSTWAFCTTLKQYLLGIFSEEMPFVPTSNNAPTTSSIPFPSVLPKTIKQSLTPLPIHRLLPSNTHPFPSHLKVVPSLVELEPTSRSVRAQPHIFLQLIRSGRIAFCWGDPSRAILLAQRGSCRKRKEETPRS